MLKSLIINNGGRGGIRTLGGFNPTAAFQATALNHYATRPELVSARRRERKESYSRAKRGSGQSRIFGVAQSSVVTGWA